MASCDFIIRCMSESGSFVVENMNSESTLGDLKMCIYQKTGIEPDSIRILCGYPPRALAEGIDDLKLKEVGIYSGENIIIERAVLGIVPEIPTSNVYPLGPRGDGPAISSPRFDEPISEALPSAYTLATGDYSRPSGAPGIMMRYVVPSNNSCLFTSVYYDLTNGKLDAKKSTDLRRVITRVVSSNPEKYNTAFLGMSNEDYCTWIESNDHWGGAIELAILSEHFELEIVAVDTVNLRMLRFGENCNYQNRIFLIYDGIHYDPLMMELENSTTQTIFRVDDDVPMEMAMEIANEARSSRQYTDMANFKLICAICNDRLRGDREAREHARATGHDKFGEIK